MANTYAITGATGNIGHIITEKLLAEGLDPFCFNHQYSIVNNQSLRLSFFLQSSIVNRQYSIPTASPIC